MNTFAARYDVFVTLSQRIAFDETASAIVEPGLGY